MEESWTTPNSDTVRILVVSFHSRRWVGETFPTTREVFSETGQTLRGGSRGIDILGVARDLTEEGTLMSQLSSGPGEVSQMSSAVTPELTP